MKFFALLVLWGVLMALLLSACGGAQRRNCGANPNPSNGETSCQETSQ